jgi:hypothetical protein
MSPTVHRNDVGHGEEGSETSAQFSEEVAALSLFALQVVSASSER